MRFIDFFSEKELLSKIIIFVLLIILLVTPWISSLEFNFDIQTYLNLDYFLQKGFYKCLLDNETFLYFLKLIFTNADNRVILITTYNIIIILLFLALIDFVNNLMTVINLLLFTFFSIFAGQFREALALALGVFALKLYLNGNLKFLYIYFLYSF